MKVTKDIDLRAHEAKRDLMDSIADLIQLKISFADKVMQTANKHDVNVEFLLQWAFENSKIDVEVPSSGVDD